MQEQLPRFGPTGPPRGRPKGNGGWCRVRCARGGEGRVSVTSFGALMGFPARAVTAARRGELHPSGTRVRVHHGSGGDVGAGAG